MPTRTGRSYGNENDRVDLPSTSTHSTQDSALYRMTNEVGDVREPTSVNVDLELDPVTITDDGYSRRPSSPAIRMIGSVRIENESPSKGLDESKNSPQEEAEVSDKDVPKQYVPKVKVMTRQDAKKLLKEMKCEYEAKVREIRHASVPRMFESRESKKAKKKDSRLDKPITASASLPK